MSGNRKITMEEDNPLLYHRSPRANGLETQGVYTELEKIIDYTKASSRQTIKRRLATFLEETKKGFFVDFLNTSITLILIFDYIFSTYSATPLDTYGWGTCLFLLRLFIFLEFCLRLYSSKEPKKFLKTKSTFIDLITTIPYIISNLSQPDPLTPNFDNLLENEVNRQLLDIILTVCTMILFFTAALQYLQRVYVTFFSVPTQDQVNANFPFQSYIFTIIVTMGTLGYENPFQGPITKAFLIVVIIISILVIPTKSSQLVSILSSKSVYARNNYKTAEQTHHIVVTGSLNDTAVQDFLREFFHQDHGDQLRHAVLLAAHPPDTNLEANVLKNEEFKANTFYIQGDILKDAELKRCQADKAKAIVILCNKNSQDANEEDARTILQAMFIKKFIRHNKASVKVCMQILRPEGKTHYYLSLNKQTKSDQVLCVEELKLSILAKSCLCPGLIALISNLISSSGEPPRRTETDNQWLDEYFHGKTFEVYKITLSSAFVGKKFSNVAAKLYKKFRAILFALEVGYGETTKIYPNPGDYVISKTGKITGYVISSDKEIADDISSYQLTQEDIELKKKFNQSTRKDFKSVLAVSSEKMVSNVFEETMTMEDEEEDDNDLNAKLKQDKFQGSLSGEYLNLEEGFHIAPMKVSLQDVTFKSMENNILASDHIILCGLVNNLKNFILPLRAKYLDVFPPVVILHTSPPNEKQWNQICYFPEIYFVKGSAMKVKDLRAANIMFANRVVILSPDVEEVKNFIQSQIPREKHPKMKGTETKNSKRITKDQEDLLDAKTIFKYKAIIKLRPDIPIITDLVAPQNLGFLINNPRDYWIMRKYGTTQSPLFAAGGIYLSAMVDSLICQGEKFDSLFEYLSKNQGIIPLGLFRGPGEKGNKVPYVVTNPDPDTILTEKDVAFILSQFNPPDSSENWGAPFEGIEKLDRKVEIINAEKKAKGEKENSK